MQVDSTDVSIVWQWLVFTAILMEFLSAHGRRWSVVGPKSPEASARRS